MIVTFVPETHQYFNERGVEVPSVTQILKATGRISHGNASEELLASSSKKGVAIHWLCQLGDEGGVDMRKVPKALRPYRKAWMRWCEASGFVTTEVEHQFISPWGYAGTIDRVGYFQRGKIIESAVIDLKSGTAIPASTNLQLIGYGAARFKNPCRRVALRIGPDGQYKAKEYPVSTWYTDLAEFLELVKKVRNGNHN